MRHLGPFFIFTRMGSPDDGRVHCAPIAIDASLLLRRKFYGQFWMFEVVSAAFDAPLPLRHRRCAVPSESITRAACPLFFSGTTMATESPSAPLQLDRPFRLFATGSRVLAQNAAGKVIDIGEIAPLQDGACQIKLDVDEIDSGPQADARAALDALVPMLTFDYLDGLFTSEGDAKFEGLLDALPNVNFALPEPVPRELVDKRPPELF
jgi:hypothetical protein